MIWLGGFPNSYRLTHSGCYYSVGRLAEVQFSGRKPYVTTGQATRVPRRRSLLYEYASENRYNSPRLSNLPLVAEPFALPFIYYLTESNTQK